MQASIEEVTINPEELKSSFIKPPSESEDLARLPITLNQYEANKKIYTEILEALTNQSKLITKGMSEEFS